MKCTEFQNDLFGYLDGKLPMEDRQAMEKHAGECPSCAAALERFRALDEAISAEKALEPNPFAHTRILQKLERRNNPRVAAGSFVLRPALLTTGLIAALTAGFLIGNSGSLRKSQYDPENVNIEQLRNDFFVRDFADEDLSLINGE